MNGRKKPRQPRWPARVDSMRLAIISAACLTDAETAALLEPLHLALAAARQARATDDEWSNLAMACAVAQAIERQRVVCGLAEHLQSAHNVLQAIAARSHTPQGWRPTPLYFHEIDALTTFVDLHHFQIKQLGAAEYKRAVHAAINEVQQLTATGLCLEAA
ncbi:hypothetical protein [Hydrogenophaga atypica]|uniref:Uncharacterized protein n=1 Tax=Hydrogenophaga atypica TaxID=249409 RepID=A0ABW2QJQ2_9BURK